MTPTNQTASRPTDRPPTQFAKAVRSISIEQLTALQQVVENGGFEAAADELHISQSAISQRIKNLESQIGQIVVQRTKPIRATETGQLLLRFARQITLAQQEVMNLIAKDQNSGAVSIRVAVNADSLESWVLPSLAPVAQCGIALDIRRQDENISAELLRSGEVMAAITAERNPVQGCSITRLGAMPYYPACTPEFRRRWFTGGMTRDSVGEAPLVQYDRNDRMQYNFIHRITPATVHPPTHYVPTSVGYNDAVALGFGWGLIPGSTLPSYSEDRLVTLCDEPVLLPLYWQQWKLSSPSLDSVAQAIIKAGHDALVQ
ncbi:LysR family transcriptional regulator ArgP [Bifidobacterium sp.]|jgi:LysR family transcriptional regulator (chromosome initiation inhibitor)|uniref:LysR family transcriptional regulator ArgP n=1 Tax=Bifidobacterium sp. TaxID=41200 RepID=UPI0025BB3AC0|nr:LysR family transcriptional regulator ArgP [Bifidobacterium sp.]MCH4210061.1 LysR family transcriptional regulator ArgP [Bifidobacterium sp.]